MNYTLTLVCDRWFIARSHDRLPIGSFPTLEQALDCVVHLGGRAEVAQ